MPFEFEPLAIPEVKLVRPRIFSDARGSFFETWRASEFPTQFVQGNVARSTRRGILRGLHFQRDPHAQAKLIRCVRGRIFDAVVHLRTRRFVTRELSEDDPAMLYVPRGFAHGYVTLTDLTEVEYAVDAEYEPSSEGGIRWDSVGIPWPVKEPILNDRDRGWPPLP